MPAGERTTKKKQKNYILACRRVSMTWSDKDMLLASDRKSTRLNSSHLVISYAVFCLKKKKNNLFTSKRCSNLHSTVKIILVSATSTAASPRPESVVPRRRISLSLSESRLRDVEDMPH